ncbi:MAG TPA: hypothetical protein VM661_16545 [Candidatus Sulfotelmatobacter sp.]|jgi:hypothetical protein|nr:hypothetical protein [Candidatus Sulfotelmatobacter sp.]
MPQTIRFSETTARELIELSAIMRAISLGRKNAGSTFRSLADRYEISAATLQMDAANL